MGKGTVISGGAKGEYQISLKRSLDKITKDIEKNAKAIVEIDKKITKLGEDVTKAENELTAAHAALNAVIVRYRAKEATDKEVIEAEKVVLLAQVSLQAARMTLAVAKLEKGGLEKRKTVLTAQTAPVIKRVWCADLSESLAGDIGTVEVNGEASEIIIVATGAESKAELGLGELQPAAANTDAGAGGNWALLPGWQKWLPTYRLGKITAINYDNNTCTLEMLPAKSRAQGLDINQAATLSNVTIEYMTCNAQAFAVNDEVVVRFLNQSWNTPRVVGFRKNPLACSRLVRIEFQTISGGAEFSALADQRMAELEQCLTWAHYCHNIFIPQVLAYYDSLVGKKYTYTWGGFPLEFYQADIDRLKQPYIDWDMTQMGANHNLGYGSYVNDMTMAVNRWVAAKYIAENAASVIKGQYMGGLNPERDDTGSLIPAHRMYIDCCGIDPQPDIMAATPTGTTPFQHEKDLGEAVDELWNKVVDYVQKVNITNGGTGYLPGTLVFEGGGGSGAAGTYSTVDYVYEVAIVAGGLGYAAGSLVFTGGGGSGAEGTYTVNGAGTITGISITNPGTGYTSAPAVQPSHAGNGAAQLTANVCGVIIGTAVTVKGNGYTSPPTVRPSHAGNGNAVLAASISYLDPACSPVCTGAVYVPGYVVFKYKARGAIDTANVFYLLNTDYEFYSPILPDLAPPETMEFHMTLDGARPLIRYPSPQDYHAAWWDLKGAVGLELPLAIAVSVKGRLPTVGTEFGAEVVPATFDSYGWVKKIGGINVTERISWAGWMFRTIEYDPVPTGFEDFAGRYYDHPIVTGVDAKPVEGWEEPGVGYVRKLTIKNGGAGYAAGSLVFSGGGGGGAAGFYTVNAAGTITSVTLSNKGSGYTSAPTVQPSHAGNGSASLLAEVPAGTLKDVNDYVNTTYAYIGDAETFDYWTFMSKTRPFGDCEDFAITKIQMLLDRGWTIADLQLEAGSREESYDPPIFDDDGIEILKKLAHVWVVVKGSIVLDNGGDPKSLAAMDVWSNRRTQRGLVWTFRADGFSRETVPWPHTDFNAALLDMTAKIKLYRD